MASFKQVVPPPRGKRLNQALARARTRAWQIVLICLLGAVGLLGTVSLVRAAAGISATKTFAFIGGDADGKADPGETIEYTVQIANANVFDATGVVFSDTVDANTTLVGGSVNVSPLALDDAYDTIGNTLLEVGVAAGSAPAVHVAGGLFANDREFLGEAGLFTITAHTNPAHGALSAFNNASGTFSYLPNPGYSGADSFSYTLTDAGGLADTATVTINVNAARVWYVMNDAPAAGLGRSADPFDTLAEAELASAANDTIYVFQGDGTSAGQNAGILLKDGQRLLGEGVALTVPVSVNGGASPTTLRPAGGRPRIDASAGSGVAATNDVPAEIRGLSLSGSANAIDITIADASAGTLAIGDNTIDGAGAEGIDINKAGAGTLTLDVQNNSWNPAGTHTGNAFDARATAGALALNFSNNSAVLSAATGVLLDGTGGTLTVTGFANNDVSGNTAGTGVSATNVRFDAIPGGAFQQVAAGATTIGESGNGVGAAGILLANVSGDLAFADLDIYANNGAGLQASSAAAYTGSAGLQLAVDADAASVSAVGGPAVDLNTVTAALPFQSIDSTNSTSTGVSLSSVSGSFSTDWGSIFSASGADFAISGGSATVSYGGSITDDVGALVTIANSTGGAKTFTGAITDGNDGDGSGVSLTNNGGATISFMGGLVLATGANPAFTATGGGTVNVCDENPCSAAATGALVNSLKTTTGTALNVTSTTIGASNLEFKSISANGAASGIVLSSTGSSGGLVVKGDSGSSNNSSGGLIQNTTGHGISLASTRNLALDQMTIQATGGSGINGTAVTNFAFTNGTITGSGDALGESNIAFNGNGALTSNNLDGTLTVTGSTLSNAFDHGIHVESDAGTLSNATIQNNTISSSTSTASSKGGGIQLIGTGNGATAASLTKATISGNTISNFPSGAGIQVSYGNASASGPGGGAGVPSSANVVTISNNTLNGGATKFGTSAILFVIGGGNAGSRSQGNLAITNNNAQNSLGTTIGVGNNGSADLTGVIDGNVVVANNTVASQGIGGGNGVSTGGSSATPHLVLSVTNNTISQTDGNGILLVGRGTSGLAELGVRNNTVAAPLSGVRPGIRIDSGTTASTASETVCLDMSGNSSAGSGGSQGIGLRRNQATVQTVFGIEGMAATSTPGVEAYIDGLNPAGNGTLLLSATSGFSSCNTTAFAPNGGPVLAQQAAPAGQPSASLASAGFEPVAISAAYTGPAAFKQTSYTWPKTDTGASAAIVSDSAHSAPALAPAPARSAASAPLNISIGTLPAGKHVTITFRVTVNDPTALGATQLVNQGQVTGSNFATVLTDDPNVAGASNPTVTAIDRPDTTVVSLDRASGNPTKNATVTWQVVFATPVDGLTSSNFSLANTGLGGSPAITSVTETSGPPATTWNVTASTGTGEGTLGLSLANDTGLSHDLTNAPFAGQAFAVDHVAPTVQSFTRYDPAASPTNADALIFEVQFSEKVFGIGTADFAVSGTSTAGIQDVAIVNTNGLYRVTLAGGDLAGYDGVVGLNLDPAASMADEAGNALVVGEPATDETYTVDNTAPSVTVEQAAGQADPTNAGPVEFTVKFSEPVSGFATGDVTLGGTAGATTGTVTEIAPSDGTTYTVAVSGMTGDGAVIASIGASKAQDAAGNTNTASTSGDNTVSYDTTAPTVTVEQAAGQADPTNAGPVEFTVEFSEPVSGFATGDVTLGGTAGATTAVVTGGPSVYSVAVSGMTGDGTVLASIGSSKAQDAAGNTNTASTSGDNTVSYDATAPTVTVEQAAGQADPSGSTPIEFTVEFSEPVSGFATGDVTLGGTAGATTGTVSEIAPNDGTTYTVAVSGMTGDGTVLASIGSSKAQDTAGNGNTASTSGDNRVLYDTVAPSVTIEQAAGQADPTNAGPIDFTVKFSEPVSGFATGDVTMSGAFGSLAGTVSEIAPNDGTTYKVAVSGMTGTGELVATIDAGVAEDLAGQPNSASTSADNTVTYDDVPPITDIDSQPADPSASADASFGFSGDDGGNVGVGGYECKLDAGAFAACSSPKSYTGLADGSHTFAVRTIDNAGNADTSPASYTWVVDTTAPDTSIDSQPADPTSSTGASFGFSGDDASGTGVSSYECKLDAGAFAACSSPKNYTSLADGSHTFAVRALDGAGNPDVSPASYTWVVDTAAPDTSIDSQPADPSASADASFGFSGDDTSGTGVASFECKLDTGAFAACSSPQSYTGLADGSHTFAVRALDALANADASPAAYTWVVDTAAPDTSIDSQPADPSNSASASFGFGGDDTSGTGVSSFECKLDAGAFAACSSAKSYTGLADGSHTFAVRALDGASNPDASPATYTWVVDTAAPNTSIDSQPADPSASADASFSFSGDDTSGTGVSGYECKLDAGAFAACSSAKSYTGLADGSHTFAVRALDGAGNPDASPAAYTWAVDTTAPTAAISSAVLGATNSSPIPVTITFDEGVGGFGSLAAAGDLVVTNGTASDLVSGSDGDSVYTFTITPASQGVVTVALDTGSVYDQAGNPNDAPSNTLSVTYDTVAPSVTVEQAAGQADPAGAAPIEFTVTFDEPVASFTGANLTLGGSAPGTLSASVSGGPSVYTVALSGMTGSGTVTAALAAGAVSDPAGNPNAGSSSTDNQVMFDPVVPIVTGIVRADPNPTAVATVVFAVTFSKDVTGVDASDFALVASGLTGAGITNVLGSGASWSVTVGTGTGDGTLRLDLHDDDSIADAASHALGGKGLGNGDFSAGEVYALDRTAPVAGSLVAANITTPGGTGHSFTVVFSDSLGIDIASLGAGDIRVLGPNGFSQLAALVGVSPATNGSPRTASYTIAAPGGAWDAADKGVYSVELQAGQVRDITGNAAAAGALGLFSVDTEPPIRRVYLPMVERPGVPDLVTSISIDPDKRSFAAGEPVALSVTVTNRGDGPAGAFWVDLYINPSSPPTAANQVWNTRCALSPCFGIAWQVPGGLAPGQSITISSQNLPAGYSVWPGWFATGTSDLYAYADSFNPGVAAGAVAERDERNNRAELHGLNVTGPNPRLIRPAGQIRDR